ncbi:kinase-like domain-containing protein [Colletotrichum godetiae]|uniref:Kinase-like domain-containing protein n=1 Tax=Colletotrichum godetiae TaxID=1209918 RepID=A0AAJ0ATS7_9PEZI|nr:kinase-like domain-containing protein [Colletotrichum godetiae]KAK1690217.1 kinase-like domain-containing protein [Colletotrichum godetiae]
MGHERAQTYVQYDQKGDCYPWRYGISSQPPADPRIQEPTIKYAPRYFDSRHLDEAQAKYGGQMNPKGYNIRLKSILGAGGYGIAAHISHKSPANGFNTDCVIKVEKSRHHANSALAREERALWKFVGAKHILQISDITEEIKAQRATDLTAFQNSHPPPPAGARLPHPEVQDKNWTLKNFQTQPIRNFVILENANLGDLGLWLSKSSRLGRRWPERAIWMLFQSLILGLVGMAYPLREHYEPSHPDWKYQSPIDEVFPDDPNFELQETVHFDLDPRNVLLANRSMLFGNLPTFKIADFGLTEFFSEQKDNPAHFNKEYFWHCRLRGKPVYYTPEQFAGDWDIMDNDLINDDGVNHFVATDGTKPPVAGNYGMHTNIYQVGAIIWCAITLSSFSDRAFGLPYRDAWGRNIVTYGGALQHARFRDVDPELTGLVQRCLAHCPSDRPTLQELVAVINHRLARNDLESDEVLSAWSRDFFTTPRVPGDEPPPVKREREDDGDDQEGDAARGAARRRVGNVNGEADAQNVQRVQAEPLLFNAFQPPIQPQFMQGNNLPRPAVRIGPVAPGFPPLIPMPVVKEESQAVAPVFVGLESQYNRPAANNPPSDLDARVFEEVMPPNNNYMFNFAPPNPIAQNQNPDPEAGLAAYRQMQAIRGVEPIPWNAYVPPGQPFLHQPVPNIQPPPPNAMEPPVVPAADYNPYGEAWRFNSVHQHTVDPAPYAQVGQLGASSRRQRELQEWQRQQQQQQVQISAEAGPSRHPQMRVQHLLQDAQEHTIGDVSNATNLFNEFINDPDAMDQD